MKPVNKKALVGLFFLAVVMVMIMYFYNRHETFLDDNNTETPISATTVSLDNVIPDAAVKDTVSSLLTELRNNLVNYNNLDAPISINDKGETCSQWGSFDNSRYILQDNNCLILDPSKKVRSCLDKQGTVQTCNALYGNGIIDDKNIIQIGPYLEEAKSRMIIGVKDIQKDLDIKTKEIDLKVSDIVGKKNIEGQQIFFIQYNLNNLDDKRKNVSKTIKETDDKENAANINQLKFSQFLENNKKNEARNNLYIKIMKWLAGIIFVLIIVYLLLQRAD
jgi:preprotein translocase subunit SecG